MASGPQEHKTISVAFWVRKLGPFLDRDGVLNLAALSIEELQVCEEFDDVLALITGDGHGDEKLYPAFQFGPSGERLPGLREVVAVLKSHLPDAWEIAFWLTTVARSYSGKSAVDLLWDGRTDAVVAAARSDVERWQADAKSEMARIGEPTCAQSAEDAR